mmetsp:Transcript_17667/g.24920  ORF Transcript_17667/g.24920 Transcript_17667/m.24920 type:complete len:544 (-) Transcript_17667:30-1661(-)
MEFEPSRDEFTESAMENRDKKSNRYLYSSLQDLCGALTTPTFNQQCSLENEQHHPARDFNFPQHGLRKRTSRSYLHKTDSLAFGSSSRSVCTASTAASTLPSVAETYTSHSSYSCSSSKYDGHGKYSSCTGCGDRQQSKPTCEVIEECTLQACLSEKRAIEMNDEVQELICEQPKPTIATDHHSWDLKFPDDVSSLGLDQSYAFYCDKESEWKQIGSSSIFEEETMSTLSVSVMGCDLCTANDQKVEYASQAMKYPDIIDDSFSTCSEQCSSEIGDQSQPSSDGNLPLNLENNGVSDQDMTATLDLFSSTVSTSTQNVSLAESNAQSMDYEIQQLQQERELFECNNKANSMCNQANEDGVQHDTFSNTHCSLKTFSDTTSDFNSLSSEESDQLYKILECMSEEMSNTVAYFADFVQNATQVCGESEISIDPSDERWFSQKSPNIQEIYYYQPSTGALCKDMPEHYSDTSEVRRLADVELSKRLPTQKHSSQSYCEDFNLDVAFVQNFLPFKQIQRGKEESRVFNLFLSLRFYVILLIFLNFFR